MDRSQMTDRMIECVAESLAIDRQSVRPTSRLAGELGADSIDFLDIMFELEAAFGVMLQKEDLNLLDKAGIAKEEAVEGGFLTSSAKRALVKYLAELPVDDDIPAHQVGLYITVETLVTIVSEKLAEAG